MNDSSNIGSDKKFELPDLDDPIVPSTPDCEGVIGIGVVIVFLAMVPGVVDLDAPKHQKCR